MYEIIKRRELNPSVTELCINAPFIASNAEPGQFVILMANEGGERIPLTIADFDREKGYVTVIFQAVGATTRMLSALREGDSLYAAVGPLGAASELESISRAAVVAGGVGSAIALPIAKKLKARGACVHSIVGFRCSDLVILEEEFKSASSAFFPVSDDGSWGERGLVTDALRRLIESGEKYDRVIAIGPLIMMKFVCALTREYSIPTTVSMNPIMIDGTGMCGCCRLTVGGETRFACVDGPDFDGHLVDFDEAMERNTQYKAIERAHDERVCNLLKGGMQNG